MKRVVAIVSLLLTMWVAGCAAQPSPVPTSTSVSSSPTRVSVPLGYEYVRSGCEPYELAVQNQFKPYGVNLYDAPGGTKAGAKHVVSVAGLGSDGSLIKVTSYGWIGMPQRMWVYPDNPPSIRGEVWHYLVGYDVSGWVIDAGVRASSSKADALNVHAPGNLDSAFTDGRDNLEPPAPPECELKRVG